MVIIKMEFFPAIKTREYTLVFFSFRRTTADLRPLTFNV